MAAWDAEASSVNWEPPNATRVESATGSGYAETKDDRSRTLGAEEEAPGEDNKWQDSRSARMLPESEQAATQDPASEPSAVVLTSGENIGGSQSAGGGVGGGAGWTGSEPAAPPSATSGANGVRRHAMAFEIARIERFGETLPPANLEKAKHVWELSRPRYTETAVPGAVGVRRIRVPPGKECEGAVPYSVWGTSWAQMGDFGLDISMYFVTIAQLIGAVLVYAALCVVAIMHFSSENYSGDQYGIRTDLRGSAVCTSISSVLVYESLDDLESVMKGRNDCPLDDTQGYADMAGVLLLFLVLLVIGKAQDKAGEYTETQTFTAKPYTVKISTPDRHADDPDRWRRLFAQFGHVSYVTVARGNGALLRALAERRRVGRMLEGSTTDVSKIIAAYKAVEDQKRPGLGPGGWWKIFLHPFGLFRDTNYRKQQLWLAHDRVEGEVVKGMHDQGLPVVKVFVTFELDASQARCLSHMSHGILDTPEEQHMYTNPNGFKETLNVMPASPAAEVLYENLHVTRLERVFAQALAFALTMAMVVISYLVASAVHQSGNPVAVAIVITIADALLPLVVREACSLERHHNSVSHDLSFMNKLTLARWANIAGIPFILNDHNGTLTESNLELVSTVLLLNVFVPSAIRMLDLPGRWERNFLAPREVVQTAMDSRFQGSRFSLSERYTDMTKTIFACLVYTPVLPLAMWMCFLALTISYWVDKFLFMRAWRTPQPVSQSGTVGKLARRHLALAVLAHCLVALYYYAGWPFDGICRFEGGWIHCSQEGTGVVEAESQDWMTGSQKTLVDVFSALNMAWLVILLVFYYLQSVLQGISIVVKGAPRKLRSRQHMPFSQLTSRYQHEVDSYVPQVDPPDQPLPLLACDLDPLEVETIPWNVDGQKGDSFENHCLSTARDLPRTSRFQRARLFSRCLHYPPPAPFENISNGRSSKTDIDWFRRPPGGLQETKMPDIHEVDNIPEAAARSVPMMDMPGLVDPDLVERHPRSQAPLESNGEMSVAPSSSHLSREREQEPMMPGGGQSSLVSTAILRVGSVEGGEGSAGTAELKGPCSVGGRGVCVQGALPAAMLANGENGGRHWEEEEQGTEVNDRRPGVFGVSGFQRRIQNPRVEHGEEAFDAFPAGNAADELSASRRFAPGVAGGGIIYPADNGVSGARADVEGQGAGESLTRAGSSLTANARAIFPPESGGGGFPPGTLYQKEDVGGLSFYQTHGHGGGVVAAIHGVPTSIEARRSFGDSGGNGSVDMGKGLIDAIRLSDAVGAGVAGEEWRKGGRRGAWVGDSSGLGFEPQMGRDDPNKDGWVDQYTHSSLDLLQAPVV